MCLFSQIYNTVMALGQLQNFVSAQYLVNQSMDFLSKFAYAFTLNRARLGLLHVWAPVAQWIGVLTLNPLDFSPLWFEPRVGHIWESQVLLKDAQVFFPWVLRFSPTFDE